jgi:hypothetical protein
VEAYWRLSFDGRGEVKMQKIVFLFDLIPGRLDQFCFVIDELKVKGKRAIKLYVQGNSFTFYYPLYYQLI